MNELMVDDLISNIAKLANIIIDAKTINENI